MHVLGSLPPLDDERHRRADPRRRAWKPDGQLVTLVRARTGGNPLFVTELLRAVPIDRVGSTGGWTMAADSVPDRVTDLVLHRLRRLPAAVADAVVDAPSVDRERRATSRRSPRRIGSSVEPLLELLDQARARAPPRRRAAGAVAVPPPADPRRGVRERERQRAAPADTPRRWRRSPPTRRRRRRCSPTTPSPLSRSSTPTAPSPSQHVPASRRSRSTPTRRRSSGSRGRWTAAPPRHLAPLAGRAAAARAARRTATSATSTTLARRSSRPPSSPTTRRCWPGPRSATPTPAPISASPTAPTTP